MDEELQRRVQFLERKLAQMEDDAAIQRRKDDYTMATLGKRNLQNNVTMDLMFAGNLVWNSSFEMPKAGVLPVYWTGGVSSTEKAFIGMVSLKLTPGQVSSQTVEAYIPASAFGDDQLRVTFAQLGGRVRCEVINESGIALLSDDFNQADSWYNGRRTVTVRLGAAVSVHVRFTCIDTGNPVYIDAVQVEPDVLRKWPSLYLDGPKSGAYVSEGSFQAFNITDSLLTRMGLLNSGPHSATLFGPDYRTWVVNATVVAKLGNRFDVPITLVVIGGDYVGFIVGGAVVTALQNVDGHTYTTNVVDVYRVTLDAIAEGTLVYLNPNATVVGPYTLNIVATDLSTFILNGSATASKQDVDAGHVYTADVAGADYESLAVSAVATVTLNPS